jgi:peptidoglycan-associated lipoprotein
MKLTKIINLLVLGSALTITAVGCKHPQNLTPLPGDRSMIHEPPPMVNPAPPFNPGGDVGSRNPTGIPATDQTGIDGWTPHPEILARATVYFDFDKSAIKASEAAKLDDVANYLKGNAAAKLKVEGNCDERGTEEYNRSLGERRALAAREHLVSLGIDPQRVVTISRGEDNPADPGHNEDAWKKNRRDEFIVMTPPGM